MKKLNYLLLLFCGSLLLISCTMYRLEKNLDPVSKEFLSLVRYTITKEERKSFLSLPPSERSQFMIDFWDIRDTDPDTEENEFKEEYMKRIDEANELFSEGSQGWLQDRGRIYIMFGAPWERQAYPRGVTFYGKPTEIWYYGYFPIIFIDQDWSGNYRMDAQSSWQIAEINKTQMESKPLIPSENIAFEFNLAIQKTLENEVSIEIQIPYKKIWFAEKNRKLETSLTLIVEIFDSSEKKVWEYNKNYPIELTEDELKTIFSDDYIIEVRANLEQGDYSLIATLENQTGGDTVWKKETFTI